MKTTKQKGKEKKPKAKGELSPKLDKYLENDALPQILDITRHWNARFAKKALERSLAEVTKVTDAADELLKMEPEIRKIYAKLDIRTKCLIDILEEIGSVDGMSVGVTFGNDMLYNIFGDDTAAATRKALPKLEKDPDIRYMAKAFQLAHLINSSH